MDNGIIQLIGVTKRFNNEIIIDRVNASFESGRIHGIVGRNGSGKSILLKIICGLVIPSSGEVIVSGRRIGKDIDFIEGAGIIIETPGFLPYYSGLKNLELLATIRHTIKQEQIIEAMHITGLDPKMRKHVSKYSSGMNQRLGIAQAIMEQPRILILDEPMNCLDENCVVMIRSHLKKLKEQGTTILITSHNREDIETICDYTWKMDQGLLSSMV